MKQCIKETNQVFITELKKLFDIDKEDVISFLASVGVIVYLIAVIFASAAILSYYQVPPDSWSAVFAVLAIILWLVVSLSYMMILYYKCKDNWKLNKS